MEALAVSTSDPVNLLEIDLSCNFTSVYFFRFFQAFHLTIGYDVDQSLFRDFVDFTRVTISTEGGSASQMYILLGWPLGQNREANVGHNQITADIPMLENGVDNGNTLDVSGVFHSIGIERIY